MKAKAGHAEQAQGSFGFAAWNGKTAKHRKKSQRQVGGKAPERRRPLWTPSDGNVANGLFLLEFAAKLPCAHSAKRGRRFFAA